MTTVWTQSTQLTRTEPERPNPIVPSGTPSPAPPEAPGTPRALRDGPIPLPLAGVSATGILALPEAEAVAIVSREYGLRTSLERSLVEIALRNLRAAQDYAREEESRRKGGQWIEQRIEIVRSAVDLRSRCERAAIQAIQAIAACRMPLAVNIVAEKVAIGREDGR